jgi:uncharacterized OB-fold protein
MAEPIGPLVNTLNSPFWEAAAQGRLVLPFCATQQCFFWPPSPVSPYVGGRTMIWREADPVGVLRSRVVYRRVFQKPFAVLMPYAIGLAELEAGPRVLAHIASPDSPQAPCSGDRVELYFASILPEGPVVPLVRKRP